MYNYINDGDIRIVMQTRLVTWYIISSL